MKILDRLKDCLTKCDLPLETTFSSDELYSVMLSDKKIDGAKINLVIPLKIGEAVLHKVSTKELKDILVSGLC